MASEQLRDAVDRLNALPPYQPGETSDAMKAVGRRLVDANKTLRPHVRALVLGACAAFSTELARLFREAEERDADE